MDGCGTPHGRTFRGDAERCRRGGGRHGLGVERFGEVVFGRRLVGIPVVGIPVVGILGLERGLLDETRIEDGIGARPETPPQTGSIQTRHHRTRTRVARTRDPQVRDP
jgi:hypothetical protein